MITTWWRRRLRTLSPKSFSSTATVPALFPALSYSGRSAMSLLLVEHGLHPDVDPGGHVQVAEFVDRLGRGLGDVDHALMGADLVLLARLLVDVRRPQHRDPLDLGGQRDRAAHLRAGPLGRVDDVHRGLVDHLVIVPLDSDADSLRHVVFAPSKERSVYRPKVRSQGDLTGDRKSAVPGPRPVPSPRSTARPKSPVRGPDHFEPAFARTASRSSG